MDLHMFVNLLYHTSPRQIVFSVFHLYNLSRKLEEGEKGLEGEKKALLPATKIINNGKEQGAFIFPVESNPQRVAVSLPPPSTNFILAECSFSKKQNDS